MIKKGYLVVIGVFLIALTSIAHADNLAFLYGNATQSSDYRWYYGAANAIDGNVNRDINSWSVTHTGYEYQAWWMVDLRTTYHINEIVIWNRDANMDRLSNFNVSVLDSQSNIVWQSDYFPYPDYPDPSLDIILPGNITGEFVKVRLNGTNYLSLAEVQVYGDTSPVPLPPSVWLFGSGLVGLIGLRRFRRS